MRMRAVLLLSSTLLCGAALLPDRAVAIPSPSLDDGSDASAPQAPPSGQDAAQYQDALALMKQGDALGTADGAQAAYASARVKLQALTARSPQRAEAWNALGYTQRKLGAYDDALASYSKALDLKPGYPEALEYRGEAFLRMNRIADAKQAYLDLFASNRTIAATLLESMKDWIRTQQSSPTVHAAVVQALQQWVQERSQIATQTAGLTRQGAAESWR